MRVNLTNDVIFDHWKTERTRVLFPTMHGRYAEGEIHVLEFGKIFVEFV